MILIIALIALIMIDRYMVDAADHDKLEASRNELHNLLDKPQLQGIPILVLGNKRDLDGALDEKELIERMWAFPVIPICQLLVECKSHLSLLVVVPLICFVWLFVSEWLWIIFDPFFFFFFFFAFPSCISGVHHFWVRFLRMWQFFLIQPLR